MATYQPEDVIVTIAGWRTRFVGGAAVDPVRGMRVCETCGVCYVDPDQAPRLCPSCCQSLTSPLLAAHMAALLAWVSWVAREAGQ